MTENTFNELNNPELELFSNIIIQLVHIHRTEKRFAQLDDLMMLPGICGFDWTKEQLYAFIRSSPVAGHIRSACEAGAENKNLFFGECYYLIEGGRL